jgi:hypothetical protein
MKVSINKPCHENWDIMEPNEKGAFCLSCQKSVIDFSNKTTNEIKSFFRSIADTEKVCGRFKEEQLTELTFDDFFARFKKWILSKKIAVVMFFVLGLSLFSCQTTKHEPLMGDVSIEEPVIVSNNEMLKGKVAYTEDTNKVVKPVEATIDDNIKMKMGEVIALPPTTSTVIPKSSEKVEKYLKGDVAFESDTTKKTNCVKKDTLPDKQIIMGKVIKRE